MHQWCMKNYGELHCPSNLVFIETLLVFLPVVLKQLEKFGLPLEKAFSLLDEAMEKIKSTSGYNHRQLKINFAAILMRNPKLKMFHSILAILRG